MPLQEARGARSSQSLGRPCNAPFLQSPQDGCVLVLSRDGSRFVPSCGLSGKHLTPFPPDPSLHRGNFPAGESPVMTTRLLSNPPPLSSPCQSRFGVESGTAQGRARPARAACARPPRPGCSARMGESSGVRLCPRPTARQVQPRGRIWCNIWFSKALQ